jgi:hypothetical protein
LCSTLESFGLFFGQGMQGIAGNGSVIEPYPNGVGAAEMSALDTWCDHRSPRGDRLAFAFDAGFLTGGFFFSGS